MALQTFVPALVALVAAAPALPASAEPGVTPRIAHVVGGETDRAQTKVDAAVPPAGVRVAQGTPPTTRWRGDAADALTEGAPAPGSGAQPAQTPPGATPAQPTNAPASIATPAPGPAAGQLTAGFAKAPPLPAQPSAAYRSPYPAEPPPTGYPSTQFGPTSPPGPQAPAVGGPGQPWQSPE